GQERLQAPKRLVAAPFTRERHGRAGQVAACALQFGLEFFRQREGVGRAAGKTRQYRATGEPAHLARIALEYGLAHRDLAVARHGDDAVAAHAENGGAVKLLHGKSFAPERWPAAAQSSCSLSFFGRR